MKKDESLELLEIVDDGDTVMGQDTRENVHRKGLLHREIHVWFVTPEGQIIFQHRAKDKDTYPDLLDATVGGHVDPGMSYQDTAIKETAEETGLKLDISDLHFLKKLRTRSEDKVTGMVNNTFRVQYAYIFRGRISDLRIENGKAVGFEAYPLNKLPGLSIKERDRFIPVNYSTLVGDLFHDIEKLLLK